MKNPLLIVACLILNVTMAQETTTIYLIRHAEKADGSADPGLSDAGKDRTKVWGNYFADKNIEVYYSTNYKRTSETASYTFGHSLPNPGTAGTTINILMKKYESASLSLKDVAKENKGKSIVIVGHSNTIPAQINALIGEKKYADIQESEYGNLYIIKISGDKITHELIKM